MTPIEAAKRAVRIRITALPAFKDMRLAEKWAAKGCDECADAIARAVLQAIREPSEGMVDSGRTCLDERGCNPLSGDAESCWSAMIDTALSE